MKKGIILGLASGLAVVHIANAETVNVQVNNSVNTSTTTTTTNSSNTKVVITQNGETKVFESNGEAIDYTSSDGSTSVKIQGNGKTATKSTSSTQETVDKVKEEVKGAVENSKKEIEQSIQKNREDTEKIVAEEVENRTQRIFTIIKDFFLGLLPK